MHQNIDYTNEDQLKQIFQLQIDDIDSFTEKYQNIVDPDISFKYFKVFLGEFVEQKGRKEYFEFLKVILDDSIIELTDVIASSKGDRLVITYRQLPRRTAPLYREGVTWQFWIATLHVRNGMIYKMRNCSNTLKTLQEYGIVTFRTEDKERIYSYLQTLVSTGLLDEKFIKMEN